MTDYSRIEQLVEATRQQVEQLAAEVQRLRREDAAPPSAQSPGDDGGGRMGAAAAPNAASRNIIPAAQGPGGEPIIGGFATRQFPDCAAIGDDRRFFCTGTLIAPNLVVTARHCLGVTRVFLKGHDVTQPKTGEIIRVLTEHAHPFVDLRVLVLEHDSSVEPRHIAQGVEAQATQATLAGFGTTNLDGTIGYGKKLMVEEVPIMSLQCATPAEANRYDCNQGFELVAGHRGLGKDSCRGDSGGPLYITSPEGGYYLLGVTSRGVADATRMCGDGGIYVRVDQFVDWIMEQTGITIPGPLNT